MSVIKRLCEKLFRLKAQAKAPGPAACEFENLKMSSFLFSSGLVLDDYDAALWQEGFCRTSFHHEDDGHNCERLCFVTAVSADRLMSIFFKLLDHLSDEVEVTLTSHHGIESDDEPCLLYDIGEIDLFALKSTLVDYEDLLLEDCSMCLEVESPDGGSKIELDDHKLLRISGPDLVFFKARLEELGLPFVEDLPLVSEIPHTHRDFAEDNARMEELAKELGFEVSDY